MARNSPVGMVTRYGLDCPGVESRCGGSRFFLIRPDRSWCTPGLPYNGYRVFPGGQTAGALTTHPPSNAEVKERAEVYLYFLSALSWPVPGRTLALSFIRETKKAPPLLFSITIKAADNFLLTQ